MKTNFILLLTFSLVLFNAQSQTTAMNITQTDCNGIPQDLFSDLDAGQAVVLYYYMPNCSTCPPPAANIQAMANKVNSTCQGMVKGYANSYLNSTTCAYTASWVTSNNLNFYTPIGGTGEEEVAYYGGFGMPTVVLLGGANHDVLFVTQNWVDSDTTTMRDLILNMACVAGTNELQKEIPTVNVFPNPVSETLYFSMKTSNNQSVFVYIEDITGRVILAKTEITIEDSEAKKSFDVSHLPEGNYFLKVEVNNTISTEKFVIQQ